MYDDFYNIKVTKMRQYGRDRNLEPLLEYFTIDRGPLYMHTMFVQYNTVFDVIKKKLNESKYMR